MTRFLREVTSVLLLIWAFVLPLCGQTIDSPSATDTPEEVENPEGARSEQAQRIHRTTLWAACMPGAGQLANRKYWKAPIVWGAMGYMVDYCAFNVQQFRLAKSQLRAETDNDPLTINSTGLTAQELTESAVFYRRNRDLAVMGIMGIHLLSILDANVDAHLMDFDVSDDLKASLFCEPFSAQAGIRLRW